MAQEWGCPPWQIEEELSLYWLEAYLRLSKEREREMRKSMRQAKAGRSGW